MTGKLQAPLSGSHDLEQECQCLFCGQSFKVKEIEFCIEVPPTGDFYDQVFEDHIRTYKGCEDKEAPYRIWLDWADDPENVLTWEDDRIPLAVRGPLRNITNTQISDFGFGLSLFGTPMPEDEPEEEHQDDKIWRRSSIRVCPRCHMTLPIGLMSDRKIRIGLLGGQRSGKTTYMVVLAKYLQHKFHGMGDGVGLGSVTLVPECEECVNYIHDHGVDPTVASAGQEEDPPVLPVVMRITPSHPDYAPFCLILQDIPGEYLRPEPQYREMLSFSNIRASTDLIMLIDINHFIKTRQQRDGEHNAERYGEYCRMDINRLFENLENLGMCLDPKQMKSLQITLPKLDFWMEEDERIAMTAFGQSGDRWHQGIIDAKRLRQVNDQLCAVLRQMEGSDYSGLMNVFAQRLNIKHAALDTYYTAVASKTVPEHEAAFSSGTTVNFSYSLNVLEPLLNVLSSHGVLPVRRESMGIAE
ncbi:MAG: hypothetical protein ACI4MJ_02795 [Aristaeellaceae bacterium]